MREQREATGKALPGFWQARCHVWLLQSQLQPEDKACLLRLSVKPTAMFGPDAIVMIHCSAQEITSLDGEHWLAGRALSAADSNNNSKPVSSSLI